MEAKRTHDLFYAKECHKREPKESFKYIFSHVERGIQKYLPHKETLKICDIGCSNGDFLYFLKEKLPSAELTGIDILQELLDKTEADFKQMGKTPPHLVLGDISSGHGLPSETYNVVFLNGVLGIFDSLEQPLKHFISLIDNNGGGGQNLGYIWALFNPYPLDVFIKAKVNGSSHLESGWNVWSKQSVLEILKTFGCNGVFYDDFSIPIEIPQTEDFLRSWTFKDSKGKNVIFNGLNLVHNFSLLEITHKE